MAINPIMCPVNFSIFRRSGMMSVLYWMHCKRHRVKFSKEGNIFERHVTLLLSVSFKMISPLWCAYFIENLLLSGLLVYMPSAAVSKSSQFFTKTIFKKYYSVLLFSKSHTQCMCNIYSVSYLQLAPFDYNLNLIYKCPLIYLLSFPPFRPHWSLILIGVTRREEVIDGVDYGNVMENSYSG